MNVHDAWTILIACACNLACGLLGCFLLLRRMSLIGDAISHAVLPGLAVAFLLSGQRHGWPIFAAAVAMSLITTMLIQWVHRGAKVPEDASIGIVFSALFALGVILITRIAAQVDLDPQCVLYGVLEVASLDTVPIGSWEVPRVMLTLAAALGITLLFILLLWKELKITSFDPALATALGIPAGLMQYLLMAMVGTVTVASFEAVGSILVIAMLIVPAAAAHLLTDRLPMMLILAGAVGVSTAVLGYAGAVWLNTSTAGMMAVVVGMQLALAVAFSPQQGIAAKWWRRRRLAQRIAEEDVLGWFYRQEEKTGAVERSMEEIAKEAALARADLGSILKRLKKAGHLEAMAPDRMSLSNQGRQAALSVIRAHRLWESFLGEHLHLPADHLHAPAERMEHYVGPKLQQAIAHQLANQQLDPQGKPIPGLPPPSAEPGP